MAWNRPTEGAKSAGKTAKKPVIARGAIAGLAVVVIGGAVVFWLCRPEPVSENRDDAAKRGRIKEVTPAAAPKTEEPKPEPPKKVDPNARPTRVGEVVNGYVMLPSGRIHKRVGVITNSVGLRAKAPYAIFEHKCNNEIACYLSIKPGDTLVGTRQYTGRFKDEFLKSIETPIIVTQDDSPEVAQLKRDVIAARLQLKDALDRGEDIEQIMIDTREQLQDMMRIKNSMQHLFSEQVKQCETEQDVDDLIEASNKMLAEKGIAPLTCNKLTKMNILRDMRERRGEPIEDDVELHEKVEQAEQGGTDK